MDEIYIMGGGSDNKLPIIQRIGIKQHDFIILSDGTPLDYGVWEASVCMDDLTGLIYLVNTSTTYFT